MCVASKSIRVCAVRSDVYFQVVKDADAEVCYLFYLEMKIGSCHKNSDFLKKYARSENQMFPIMPG